MRAGRLSLLVMAIAVGCAHSAPPPGAASAPPASAGTGPAGGDAQASAPIGPAAPGADADAVRYYDWAVDLLRAAGAKAIPQVDFSRLRRAGFLRMEEPAPTDSTQSPDAAIARDYTDLRAHATRMMALRQQGKHAEAADERSILKAFLDSIFSSGDGRSEKTAWTVYRVADEYVVMGALGLELERQALNESGERSYDIMTCTTETKKKVTLYFDITEHMAAEARRFEQPSGKK